MDGLESLYEKTIREHAAQPRTAEACELAPYVEAMGPEIDSMYVKTVTRDCCKNASMNWNGKCAYSDSGPKPAFGHSEDCLAGSIQSLPRVGDEC